MSIVQKYGRNTLTIVDEEEGGSKVYGSWGADDRDALDRFGRGRMWYSRQFGCLYVYNFILQRLSRRPLKRILHIGCGEDYVRRVLESNYVVPSEEYVGIDLHASNLQKALHFTNAIAADYYAMDLRNGLGKWQDDYFDAVIAIDVVEHLPTKKEGERLISEILRVAGGIAIISTPQVLPGQTLRYSDLHKYEFTKDELANVRKNAKDKFAMIEQFGVNIGTAEYERALATESHWLKKADNFLSPKIMRGIFAAGHPEISNDLLMSFER